MIDTIVFINNAICTDLTRKALAEQGISLDRVALFALRKMPVDWAKDCGLHVDYGVKAALNLRGQTRVIDFYRTASKQLRALLNSGHIAQVYLCNNDNLLCNHTLRWSEDNPNVTVTIVAEGFMNYQDIGLENRAGWRWRVKALIAAGLRLRYSQPSTHLSGAFEPSVDHVISFAAEGLMAPADKVQVIAYPQPPVRRACDPKIGLIVHTGIFQWMTPEQFSTLAHGFAAYVRAQGFTKLYAKPHPHYPAGLIEELLPPHEIMGVGQNIENLAPELEAGTLLATCSTALVTAKLIRSELRCVDFGADFYLKHAYQNDPSVARLMTAVGVEMVPLTAQ